MPLIPGGGRKRFRAAVAPPEDLGVNTIFFDDWTDDIGWVSIPTGWSNINTPSKWDAYSAITVEQEVIAGAGRNGGPALRQKYTWPFGYRETGRLECEFPETTVAHIRMWMKFSDGFAFGKIGEGGGFLWKQWRIHQSPWTRGLTPPFGTNGEDNSGYIVNTMRGGADQTSVAYGHTACWRSDSGVDSNSANGALCVYQFRELAHRIPWGTYDAFNCVVTDTDWVQCDVYYELGDVGADNGKIYQWFNGVAQPAAFTSIGAFFGGSLPTTGSGLVTDPRSHYGNPPGFNRFTLLDNYINLTLGWTQQHYVYIDSIGIYDGKPNDLEWPT